MRPAPRPTHSTRPKSRARPTRLAPLAAALALAACLPEPAPETLRISGETMGTTYSVTAVAPPDTIAEDALQSRVEAALAEVNATMSNWDPGSEISRFNAAATTDPQPVSPDLHALMTLAAEVHDLSGGRFDVTVAPLIDLWGFGPRTPDTPVPDAAALEAARAAVGQAAMLTLGDGTLAKARPDVTANLSAIAKGWGVDRVAATLRAAGIDDYLVEIGGEIVAAGTNAEGAPWRIGIERPDAGTGTVERVVDLRDAGLATSGDYRNYVEQDGVRLSHIIDPVTARPIAHRTASVTVIADTAARADALATALLVADSETARAIAAAHDIAAFLLVREGDGFAAFETDAFSRYAADGETGE